MANELSLTCAGSYAKNSDSETFPGVSSLLVTVSGNTLSKGVMSVTNTPAAIPLAGLTSPFGFALFRNNDTVNTINLKDQSSGHIFGSMLPGEPCGPIRLGSDVTAPQAVTVAGTALMSFIILPP